MLHIYDQLFRDQHRLPFLVKQATAERVETQQNKRIEKKGIKE